MKKSTKLLVSLLLCLGIISLLLNRETQAWLLSRTKQHDNQFSAGTVDHEIEENFNQEVKQDVRIQNTGTVPAFIRVKVVPRWLDAADDVSLGLEALKTYDITYADSAWFEKDGFWYYPEAIEPEAYTGILIKKAQPKANLPTEYQDKRFDLQIIVQSVQSQPIDAVTELWGINPHDL